MALNNPYSPVDSAAMATGGKLSKSPTKGVKPVNHAAVPKHVSKPIGTKIPPNVSPDPSGFPGPNDPYWKKNPILTEHKDGTVRRWGEDIPDTVNQPQNTLPKQMMPPPPVPTKKKQDYYEGHSTPGSGYLRYHQD